MIRNYVLSAERGKIMRGYGIYQTDYGCFKIGYDNNYLIYLKSIDVDDEVYDDHKTEFSDHVYSELVKYFNGELKEFNLPIKLEGTAFQKNVWNKLMEIPYGQTTNYKEIAVKIENQKAVRAVGTANGNNPIWIVIPCHRVIASDGTLAGYAGGLEMKKFLLDLEKNNI